MDTLDTVVARPGWRDSLRDFFFKLEVPYSLAIMRIWLSATLFVSMLYRWTFTRELFSSDGCTVPLWSAYNSAPWFPIPSAPIAVGIHSVLLMTLLTSCIGWCSRASLAIASVTFLVLNLLDIIGTMNKSSVIAIHLMFLLTFSGCGSLWSVDSWLRRSRIRAAGLDAEPVIGRERFPVWPRRLMQLLMGAVYFGAAMTKLHIPAFFSGEQLQTWMITTYNYPNLLGHRFAMHPSVLVIFAYITTLWEVLFLFTAWRGIRRCVMLSVGTLFHAMTCFTLGLIVFPLVCIASYLAFFDEADFHALHRVLADWRSGSPRVRRLVARLKGPWMPAPRWALAPSGHYTVFASLAAVVAIGGIALEYQLDLYGMRRPQGPYTLKELDPDRVAEMIAATPRIRQEDKIFNFDVGSIVVAGTVIDRRDTFRQGEVIRVQCGILPPHEDLALECNLHDSQDRLVNTVGLFIGSEMMRALFYYNIDESTAPGSYSLVLKVAGEEVLRRPITITPGVKTASAN